ncbi:hypothetical protein [Microtetraspora malaysiensis]|uniref:hypothetical protein n=1 Tax=Microtetraspora malaysiensis TaxID=161358 RepID=UPI003D928CB5
MGRVRGAQRLDERGDVSMAFASGAAAQGGADGRVMQGCIGRGSGEDPPCPVEKCSPGGEGKIVGIWRAQRVEVPRSRVRAIELLDCQVAVISGPPAQAAASQVTQFEPVAGLGSQAIEGTGAHHSESRVHQRGDGIRIVRLVQDDEAGQQREHWPRMAELGILQRQSPGKQVQFAPAHHVGMEVCLVVPAEVGGFGQLGGRKSKVEVPVVDVEIEYECEPPAYMELRLE